MEHDNGFDYSGARRKRKLEENDCGVMSLDELNQDLLERVLSWLPTSTFFRLSSVCKRWRSVAASPSFKLACSQIPSRDPFFMMVGPQLDKSVVFDMGEKNWKQIDRPPILKQNCNSIPVAASGGLVCFRSESGDFVVCNPVTGSCREIPPAVLDFPSGNQAIHAIVMQSYSKPNHSFKIVLVYGELARLHFKVFNSILNRWEDEVLLRRKTEDAMDVDLEEEDNDDDDDDAVYFLSKAGNVVATDMLRSPSKQYSSVLITKDGQEIVYFLSSSGMVVACNLTTKCFFEYPRLLPVYSEYSVDVVESRGEMVVVVLSEFLESASLRMWRFDETSRSWQQIAAMPPALSHEFYGKKADINCVGAGDHILICLNSAELCKYILYNFVGDEWTELPNCSINGESMEFMSAFSFEPRIEFLL